MKRAGGRNAEGFDVCLGENPGTLRCHGLAGIAKKLLNEAKVCVSPGIGFGDYGDTHVRFALIENRDRIRQAIRGIKAMFRADGLLPASSKHIHENAE